MRLFLLLISLAFSHLAFAYGTIENLSISSSGLERLLIETGSGNLIITGTDEEVIQVELVIEFPREWDDDEAREYIEESLLFEFEVSGDELTLHSSLENSPGSGNGIFSFFVKSKSIPNLHLKVKLPQQFDLTVNDGSGNMEIVYVNGNVEISDGSGNIKLSQLGSGVRFSNIRDTSFYNDELAYVDVNDGSGNIDIQSIAADLRINDGSGNIVLSDVLGSVIINDGSGNVNMDRVNGSVRVNDGSGNIDARNLVASITVSDGSGDIDLSDVAGDVIIRTSGSGSVRTHNIGGNIIGD